LFFFGTYDTSVRSLVNPKMFTSYRHVAWQKILQYYYTTIVVFYSTLSSKKFTKLNTEKQHAQGHLGSNLTPEGEK
jgi:hypothetical protein